MIPSSPLSLQARQYVGAIPPFTSQCHWWQQSVAYIAAGLRIVLKDLPGLITLVGLFQLPPLAAVIIGSRSGWLAFWIAWALPWISITLGNVAVTLAIADHEADRSLLPGRTLIAAVRWLPRYLWTNALTSILFWGVFTPLQWIIGIQVSRWSWPPFTPTALLLLPMLFWHVRLVFATYATFDDHQSGVCSVRTSIKLAQKRWVMIAGAFAGAVLVMAPVAGPLYLLALRNPNPVVVTGFTWLIVMAMRPLLIATTHGIYQDFGPALARVEPQEL